MSQRILVPLDGSDFSEQALDCACEIAQRAGADVHLVRVQEPAAVMADDMAGSIGIGAYNEITLAVGEYLVAHAVQVSREFGLAARVAALHGAVAPAIASYVADADIDLVVMTSHGRTGFGRAVLGSVADSLARTLTVPILLLRPSKTGNGPHVPPLDPRRVLIPLDGSVFAETVIEQAIELGWPSGARYTLLQVLAPPYPVVYGDNMALQRDDAEFRLLQDQAHDYLERVASRLRARGLRVDVVVITHPDTAAGIIQESMACEADLIAMTTHGRSGWQRLLMGSTAERVLHTAQVPLLVLKGNSILAEERRSLEALAGL